MTDLVADNPSLQTLKDWWEGARAGRDMPQRGDLRPRDLTRILANLALVDAAAAAPEGEPRFTYRLSGTAIDSTLGMDLKGRTLDAGLAGMRAPQIVADYMEAIAQARPIARRIATVFGGNRFVEYDRLAVPLRNPAAPGGYSLACVSELRCAYEVKCGRPPGCPGSSRCMTHSCLPL